MAGSPVRCDIFRYTALKSLTIARYVYVFRLVYQKISVRTYFLVITKPFKSYIYNGLAWDNLLINNLYEADKYSELAYKIGSNETNI